MFWKDKIYQNQRYEILTKIIDRNIASDEKSIHDFGCGYGAFYDYLKDQEMMENTTFFGTDVSAAMIREARRRITDGRAKFFCNSFATQTADYTFASGTYNMKLDNRKECWNEYVKASLTQIWSKTRKGLAFNMLRDDVAKRFSGLYYIDGLDLLSFCKRNLSRKASIERIDPLPDWFYFVHRI